MQFSLNQKTLIICVTSTNFTWNLGGDWRLMKSVFSFISLQLTTLFMLGESETLSCAQRIWIHTHCHMLWAVQGSGDEGALFSFQGLLKALGKCPKTPNDVCAAYTSHTFTQWKYEEYSEGATIWRGDGMSLLLFPCWYSFAGHLEQFFNLGEPDSNWIREKELN